MSLPPHRAEREAICDLFLELGPDAPTLDEGFTTQDLAAHLYIRERRPIAAQGIMIKQLGRLQDRGIASLKHRLTYDVLVDRLRNGPPWPLRPMDRWINVHELYIHHERGRGDPSPRPFDDVADVEAAMWSRLRLAARFLTLPIRGVAVDLVSDDGAIIRTGRAAQRVTLVGRPGELALYLSGRQSAANVRVEASADAKVLLERARLGI